MNVPFSSMDIIHSELNEELHSAFDDVLSKGIFVHGKNCSSFEKEFAKYCGSKYCVGCGNGLDSITLAIKALGIGHGDEVILPTYTFVATALAVCRVGAKPVFVDSECASSLIDTDKITEKINDRTKAILPVHLFGQPAKMDAIRDIATEKNLFVIADAAQSHGSKFKGKKISKYADVTCFSFYPSKNLGALGDGGAVVTDDEKLSEQVRVIANYGSREKYVHECIGVNSRLDEIQSAFLRIKLKHLDDQNAFRKQVAKRYCEEVTNPNIELPTIVNGDHVWHIFPIHTGKRDSLMEYLSKKKIGTGIHYPIPLHKQKVMKPFVGISERYLTSERLANEELSLPMFYGISDDQIDYVIDALNRFGKK